MNSHKILSQNYAVYNIHINNMAFAVSAASYFSLIKIFMNDLCNNINRLLGDFCAMP